MTKKTLIKMEEKINSELLKAAMKKLIRDNEVERSLYNKLEGLKKKAKKDLITVKYDYVKIIDNKVYGRLFPIDGDVNNYCCTESSIRSYFAKEYYKYIDLSACHARILRDLAAHYEINNKDISDYCEDRNAFLRKYNMDKKTINEQCNNEKLYVKHDFAINIYNMIYSKNGIVSRLIGDEYFKPLWDDVKKKEENVKGKFIALVCQTFESYIIRRAIDFLGERGHYPNSYIYDGLLYKKEYDLDIENLNRYLDSEYLGVRMTPLMKFEDFEISDQYMAYFNRNIRDIEEDDDSENDDKLDITDSEVATYILESNKNKIINNRGKLYAYSVNRWTDNVREVFDEMLSTCELNINGNPKLKPKLVKNYTSHWKNYNTQIYNLCKLNLEAVDLLDVQTGIVPFLDGVYNLKEGRFQTYKDFGICYATMCVQRKFPRCTEKVEFVKNMLIDMFDGNKEMLIEFLTFVARSLGQNVGDKLALDVIGDRNSGKGVLSQLIEDAFIGIVGNVNLDSFKSDAGKFESAERKNGFLQEFCNNRICVGSEQKPCVLDGTMWRKAISGGDLVSYRVAYGKPVIDKVKSTLISFKNNTSVFDQSGSNQTLIVCNMPCSYQDEVPDNSIDTGLKIKKGNNKIKDILKGKEYIEAFTLLVLEHYTDIKPDYPIFRAAAREINEVDDSQDDLFKLRKCIDEMYVITPMKRENRIKQSEVHKALVVKDSNFRPSKIKNILRSLNVDERKNSVMYYVGIAKRDSE